MAGRQAARVLAGSLAGVLLLAMSLDCTVHIGELVTDSGSPDTASSGAAANQESGSSVITTAYRDAVIADGPIAYWRFGESSGTVAVDASGRGNHARYSGSCAFGTEGALASDPDTAVGFDGATTGVSGLGSAFDPSGTKAFSIEGWVKPLLIEGGSRRFFSREWSTPSGRQNIGMALSPTAGLIFERWVDGAVLEVAIATATGSFVHVVGTYDGRALALYKDGVLAGTVADVRPATVADALFFMGGSDFRGVLDEVAVYDQALSAERVKVHHDLGSRD
ncbi:MAG: Autotransporter adhesin [Labilithrix sp.]|nr:Autotransporter adhesin [Labilithrix sp.]